ncbi:MAG: AbrB/MazE/SpoVT family DNA-binding domain-containing protein [Oscillospiraceae bacterium]|nr:AbrB/MazE/SpoVT family DNA-binding domain-containing protein [Oscillospiraceae bacterium]
MEMTKKLTRSCTVTIPRQIRHELGIHPGTPIVISTTANGGLYIKKHVPVCRACGSVEHVAGIGDTELCRACYAELGRGYHDE